MAKHRHTRFPDYLIRREGRTVLGYPDGSIDVRFDSENDRSEFEGWCKLRGQFLEAANRRDYGAAAHIVLEAMNDDAHIISDEYDLLDEVGNETTREQIRLAYEKVLEETLLPIENAIEMRWPIEGGKKP